MHSQYKILQQTLQISSKYKMSTGKHFFSAQTSGGYKNKMKKF